MINKRRVRHGGGMPLNGCRPKLVTCYETKTQRHKQLTNLHPENFKEFPPTKTMYLVALAKSTSADFARSIRMKPESRCYQSRNQFYTYPLRRCCECRAWARLGDWSSTPPETNDRCYVCAHQACDGCADRWGRMDENMRVAAYFAKHHAEQHARALERKKVAPWVVEAIERHGK